MHLGNSLNRNPFKKILGDIRKMENASFLCLVFNASIFYSNPLKAWISLVNIFIFFIIIMYLRKICFYL